MKLYVKTDNEPFDVERVPEYVICVDPGQSTLGVYIRNMRTGEDKMIAHITKGVSAMGVSMAETISRIYDMSLNAFKEVLDFVGESKDVVFICEQTTTAFTFASGIIACLQCWVTLVKKHFNCTVIFVSNRLTAFFLKAKKIKGADSKRVILGQFPEMKEKIDKVGKTSSVYSHACDAVLMCWAVYYDTFNFKSLRKLKTEIKYI